jgi:hypothetical protein
MAPQSLGGHNKTHTHKLTLQNKTKNIQDIITSNAIHNKVYHAYPKCICTNYVQA